MWRILKCVHCEAFDILCIHMSKHICKRLQIETVAEVYNTLKIPHIKAVANRPLSYFLNSKGSLCPDSRLALIPSFMANL